jgi:hypothetical protein
MTSQYLFTVEVNEESKNLIKTLRKNLRNTNKGIRVWGRGHRHGVESYRQDLPVALASSWAVYTYVKPMTRWVKVVDVSQQCGYRYVQQPTKWYKKVS